MIAYPQCIPCLVNQGLNAVGKLNLGEDKEREIALRVVKLLSEFDSIDKSPAYYAYFVQEIVKELSGTQDPFREQKRLANEKALEILGRYGEDLIDEEDKLAFSLKLSAMGNYIDFAIRGDMNIEQDLRSLSASDFVVWDYKPFKDKLSLSKKVLILGDNAGEIVFDKPLVEVLLGMEKDVIYAVKGSPILNDATLEVAKDVYMTSLCRVIDNGSGKVGTLLEDCSEEFLEEFWNADIVLSKGQANYETLSNAERDIFFLLVAKCEPIARETGGEIKKFIFKFKP